MTSTNARQQAETNFTKQLVAGLRAIANDARALTKEIEERKRTETPRNTR